MTGILCLITFLPLLGVAAILVAAAFGRPDDRAGPAGAARWIALATTLATFGALDRAGGGSSTAPDAGFQFVEDAPWFAGLHYRMGVDGISVLFVLLTAFLMPLCIVASWNSIRTACWNT